MTNIQSNSLIKTPLFTNNNLITNNVFEYVTTMLTPCVVYFDNFPIRSPPQIIEQEYPRGSNCKVKLRNKLLSISFINPSINKICFLFVVCCIVNTSTF